MRAGSSRRLFCAAAALFLCIAAGAQKVNRTDFKEAIDSLEVLLEKRTEVQVDLVLKKVLKRGSELDFYFNETLGDYPWRTEDIPWLRKTLKSLFPDNYKQMSVGNLMAKNTKVEEFPTPRLGYNGHPVPYKYNYSPVTPQHPLVTKLGARKFSKGLSGRTIALWQSHGRYYDSGSHQWMWQRAAIFRTVEDMYTQSYVLPFLIPMLENAGAYVMTPRERDTQIREIIIDNDPCFEGERPFPLRQAGKYSEKGAWSDAGAGFADTKAVYHIDENPFQAGTARMAKAGSGAATASWSAAFEESGSYALYISYASLPESSTAAHYTVHHLGGKSDFLVNQQMGGGTWIYLGTFNFDSGMQTVVTLSNEIPEGSGVKAGACISADAVKIGGGMGKIARGDGTIPEELWTTSGLPAYAEGALYSMQWAGVDTTVTGEWKGDYTRDFASRGAWVGMMSGGSATNPDKPGKGIPVDLSFAFHSDAGITPNDSTIGTLTIYTLTCDGKTVLPNGRSRAVCRSYADIVQSQICNDLRAEFDPEWRRREIRNRSYSESRTTTVPGMLLELLSHQNFADMRYGLDPSFRFTACRAVYKGMLKFLSNLYNIDYVVQPLPVREFSAALSSDGGSALLKWQPTKDTLEVTAVPTGYLVYTRVDNGVFDNGKYVRDCSATMPLKPGHCYSYKVVALNDGGLSFPSEILSVGVPSGEAKGSVLVVNNFDRISGPAWFDTPEYAGFIGSEDSGVPYMKQIDYIGEDYQHRRDMEWNGNENPGFGATFDDKAGSIVAGNTFDFCFIHGKALLETGYSFCSASRDAWVADSTLADGKMAVDLVCGKQVTVASAKNQRFTVFPQELQDRISGYTARGGNMIISGAYIATDVWDKAFPVAIDSAFRESSVNFVRETLGYRWVTGFGSRKAAVKPSRNKVLSLGGKAGEMKFCGVMNPYMYCVESPDGIGPVTGAGTSFLSYSDTGVSAAVAYKGKNYRVVSFGFPLETLRSSSDLQILLSESLLFFQN